MMMVSKLGNAWFPSSISSKHQQGRLALSQSTIQNVHHLVGNVVQGRSRSLSFWTVVVLSSLAGIITLSSQCEMIQALTSEATASSHHHCRIPPPLLLKQLLNSKLNGQQQGLPSTTTTTSESKNLPILMPCCYDGLTARLVARAGFSATFMTGFGVSSVHGFPDTQLISFAEMQATALRVSEGLASVALEQQQQQSTTTNNANIDIQRSPIPCIADGDTGYGNAVNVKRTIFGYGRANMAGVMIEDQVAPKRCGHVAGKMVVDFQESIQRIQAACDARDEYESLYGPGTGPLILARTDSLRSHGFEHAMERCLAFWEMGCDMTFLEAPESVEQMEDYCRRVPGPKLANMLEMGRTPILPPQQLYAMGYTMAAYPLTLLSASIQAMQQSLQRIRQGIPTDDLILSFEDTKDAVGFTLYGQEENRYRVD